MLIVSPIERTDTPARSGVLLNGRVCNTHVLRAQTVLYITGAMGLLPAAVYFAPLVTTFHRSLGKELPSFAFHPGKVRRNKTIKLFAALALSAFRFRTMGCIAQGTAHPL
jgi:hypothetical protein